MRLLLQLLLVCFTVAHRCGEFESSCSEVGKNSIIKKCTIYGDGSGFVTEMYVTDIVYYEDNCYERNMLYSVTNKIEILSRQENLGNSSTLSGTYKDVEVTISNYDLWKNDGVYCIPENSTSQPVPLSEISCYYANVPLFYSYQVLISTQQQFFIQYFGDCILLDGLRYDYKGPLGCTDYDPTDNPHSEEEPRRETIMNIIAGFILVLLVVYLIIKCILSFVEDRRYMNIQERNQSRKMQVEVVPTGSEATGSD